ncbi:MAG: hypothetical protein U0V75_17115 [Ferruginibacter sp.]
MSFFKKKIVKWTLLVIVLLGATAAVVGYKMYNKPHRSVQDADAMAVSATDLVTKYETDETASNKQYLDKVLNVTGEVSSVAQNQKGETVITLKGSDMGGVICTMEGKNTEAFQTGSMIQLQGICTGYLTDVVLVRCYSSKK